MGKSIAYAATLAFTAAMVCITGRMAWGWMVLIALTVYYGSDKNE